MHRSLPLLSLLLATFACSAPEDAPVNVAPATATASTCTGTGLRVYDEEPGILERLTVDLPTPQGPMQFMIDTGSAHSFFTPVGDEGPTSTPTTIGCTPTSLKTMWGFTATTAPDGATIGGVLGADLVKNGGTLDLRVRERKLDWLFAKPDLPPNAITLPLTFSESADPWAEHMLVASSVQLDGQDVRLLLDTGSPHVIIMSNTPRPNERVEHTFDGNGNPVTLYISTISIAFNGGPPETVLLDRAESFPALEETFAALGGSVTGIRGLGALGHDRIVIAKDQLSFVP
jgi:hypothetical protein